MTDKAEQMNEHLSGRGLPNTAVLCFVMGNQGGTVHQVARDLGVEVNDILYADYDKMGELCRKAQAHYWQTHNGDVNRLIFKHLTVCLDALKADYNGHDFPAWLERAIGVQKIAAEYLSVAPSAA